MSSIHFSCVDLKKKAEQSNSNDTHLNVNFRNRTIPPEVRRDTRREGGGRRGGRVVMWERRWGRLRCRTGGGRRWRG